MPNHYHHLIRVSIPPDVPLYVATHSPGDGLTRYRFFDHLINGHQPQYDEGLGIYTALGAREAHTFIDGYIAGYRACQKEWHGEQQ